MNEAQLVEIPYFTPDVVLNISLPIAFRVSSILHPMTLKNCLHHLGHLVKSSGLLFHAVMQAVYRAFVASVIMSEEIQIISTLCRFSMNIVLHMFSHLIVFGQLDVSVTVDKPKYATVYFTVRGCCDHDQQIITRCYCETP